MEFAASTEHRLDFKESVDRLIYQPYQRAEGIDPHE